MCDDPEAFFWLFHVQLSSTEAEQRVQWVRDMRKLLSPPEMIQADGSVNQDFFKPKKATSPFPINIAS